MPDGYATLANPLMKDIGPIAERNIPSRIDTHLPEEIEVISADNHWEITEDIFYDNFPKRLKEQAQELTTRAG